MALTLEIVTPAEKVLTVQADEVRLPGASGGFGVRPQHTPLVAALAAGELAYLAGGQTHRFAVGEGFAEVAEDKVRVLVEEAYRAEDLDPAQVQKELAERRKALLELTEGAPGYELRRAQLERAAARAFVAGK